ncbi:Uma2 family endonuclease [Streptomyces hygroscopicus subsp. hygroscopicus]|nr:Uma2 family endonuclease [Streptomyces hygroscopicus]MBW8088152.1 Uma2 family endonuclease [Streptomyces hygroscopicus subsp. hygroscopicus]
MTAEPQRTTWPVPPPDGYTVDDLYNLPDLPPHTELIDGSLVFVSPQRVFHMRAMFLLESGLHRTVPDEFLVSREMTVVLGPRNAPEPDLLVVRAEAERSDDQSRYEAADVVLAVEIVSPDSEDRDRETKPLKYAAAGIPHFWLVEKTGEGRSPAVHTYELDPVTKSYTNTGIYHERLKLTVPFTIDIDLTAIARR